MSARTYAKLLGADLANSCKKYQALKRDNKIKRLSSFDEMELLKSKV